MQSLMQYTHFLPVAAAAACMGSAMAQEVTTDLSTDVQALFAAWGPCDGDCPWDLNSDGQVDELDMVLLFSGNPLAATTTVDDTGITVIDPMSMVPPIAIGSDWSSGAHTNSGEGTARLASHTFSISNAAWIRLRFSDWNLGSRSSVTITSQDGQSQRFTGRTLEGWQGYTAFFSGSALQVDLDVAPGDHDVFVEAGEINGGYQTLDNPLSTLCGADNKINSTDARVGRIRTPGGSVFCTAWLASNGAVLTAGHCVDFGSPGDGTFDLAAGTVVEFDPPDSTNCGTPIASAPEDQFPINTTNPAFDNTAIGQDFAVMGINANADGNRPHILRGFFRMTREVPVANATIRITGCGNDVTPTGSCGGANSDSQTLQTATGPFVGEFSSGARFWHRYATDTTGNNSGSPVIWNANGVTIGIHTNAGCNPDGTGSNHGCSFEHTALELALEEFPPGATAGNTVFLDIGWPDLATEIGTVLQPYDTLANAVSAVPAGGMISVVEGTYTAGSSITIDKAMTFDVPVGTVLFQ